MSPSNKIQSKILSKISSKVRATHQFILFLEETIQKPKVDFKKVVDQMIRNLNNEKMKKSDKFDTLDEKTDEQNTDSLKNDLKQQHSKFVFKCSPKNA
jgi:flagellar biosynthesis chaperone FliJ